MALPTCECVAGLPIGEQLAAIYCATYTLAAGDTDGPYLLKAANLSDVADPVASRVNLGAGVGGIWPGSLGGTGVANTGKTITLGGNLTTVGAFATTLTMTGATGVTLPTTGTLATLAGAEALTNKTISGASNTITNVSLTTGVTGILPVANGGTGVATLYKFAAFKPADQAIVAATPTKVTFATEEYDVGAAYASSTFTAPAAGHYAFGAAIYNDTATVTALYLYKNGAQFKRLSQLDNGSGNMIDGNTEIQLALNDTVEIWVNVQNNSNIIGASTISYFYGHLMP